MAEKTWKEWWDKTLTKKLFVDPVVNMATLPGDVLSGKTQVFNQQPQSDSDFSFGNTRLGPQGYQQDILPYQYPATSQGLIERSAEYGSTIPMGGLAAGGSAAGRLAAKEGLFANPMDFGPAGKQAGFDPAQEEFAKLLDEIDKLTGELVIDEPTTPQWKPSPEVVKKLQKALSDSLEQVPFNPDDPIYAQGKLQGMQDYPPSADEILKPKPLDTEKYPWLAAPKTPDLINPFEVDQNILSRWDPEYKLIRDELYRRGDTQDELNRINELVQTGSPDAFAEALDISNRLRMMLHDAPSPESYSLIVPHAVDTAQLDWEQQLQRMLETAGEINPNLASAAEQGFSPEVLLRGTRSATDAFTDPRFKSTEHGTFYTDAESPEIANNYGRYIYPVVTRADNVLERDFGGQGYSDNWMNPFIQEARSGGHDMAIARNMYDDAGDKSALQDQWIVLDPSIVRSLYAKFDPKRRGENNLLAAEAFGFDPWALMDEENRPKEFIDSNDSSLGIIDMNRPEIYNPDGSISTERSITIESPFGNGWLNIPSIVDGKQLSEEEATKLFLEGKNPPFQLPFKTMEEAVDAARRRSEAIGPKRGF